MKSNQEIEVLENDKKQVKENSEVAHWSKKYDISAEDLNNGHFTRGIYDRIVESFLQKAN